MSILASLARDFRFAVRQMRQTPLVSGVALVSLALGIGANVAIFSLVNALLLKALPVHEPERLVQLQLVNANPLANTSSFTNPQWEYLRDHQDFFAGASAVGQVRFNLSEGGEVRPVAGIFVDGRFFNTLGVSPLLGRLFAANDDRRGGGPDGPVAVLSYGFLATAVRRQSSSHRPAVDARRTSIHHRRRHSSRVFRLHGRSRI
ncbi:MAG: ABC transporter permease [Vicinamibacterales bacterium]